MIQTGTAVLLADFRNGADMRRVVIEFPGGWRVIHDTLRHLPYGLFLIYKRTRYVGAQISFPCKSDCEWHDRQQRHENVVEFAKHGAEFQIVRHKRAA